MQRGQSEQNQMCKSTAKCDDTTEEETSISAYMSLLPVVGEKHLVQTSLRREILHL